MIDLIRSEMIDFEFFFDNFDIHHIIAIAKEENVVVVAEIDKYDFERKNCKIDKK